MGLINWIKKGIKKVISFIFPLERPKPIEIEEPPKLNTKSIYHVKGIYDSDRGMSHDFWIEGEITVIKFIPITLDEVEELVKELINARKFIDATKFKRFKDFCDKVGDYLEYEVGLERETLTNEPEKEELRIDAYGYHL